MSVPAVDIAAIVADNANLRLRLAAAEAVCLWLQQWEADPDHYFGDTPKTGRNIGVALRHWELVKAGAGLDGAP